MRSVMRTQRRKSSRQIAPRPGVRRPELPFSSPSDGFFSSKTNVYVMKNFVGVSTICLGLAVQACTSVQDLGMSQSDSAIPISQFDASADAGVSDSSGDAGVSRTVFGRFSYLLSPTGETVGQPRIFEGYDGDNGMRLRCNVSETAQRRTLSFSVEMPSLGTGLSITGAEFARRTGPLAAESTQGCSVSVREGHAYAGVCGGSEPSAQAPCRINNVEFRIDLENGASVVVGRVLCRGLTGASVVTKDLSSASFAERAQGAAFTIYDCSGLAL